MLDVQRQRLRHLMVNAILDLWKKETGSLSSVIIEGTICITSGNGCTTVVQVANKFLGIIPDRYDTSSQCHSNDGGMDRNNHQNLQHSVSLDLTTNHSHSAELETSSAYLADVSARSPSRTNQLPTNGDRHESRASSEEQRSKSSSSDQVFYPTTVVDNGNNSDDESSDSEPEICDNAEKPLVASENPVPRTMSYSVDELSSSGYSSMLSKSYGSSLGRSHASSVGNLSSVLHERTFSDKSLSTPLRRRSASPSLGMDSPSISTSTPKDVTKRPRLDIKSIEASATREWENPLHEMKAESDSNGEIDVEGDKIKEQTRCESNHVSNSINQRDPDLVLSPPQNYTAQVRDVIRQRLLANRGNSIDSPGDESSQENKTNISSTSANTSTAMTVDTSSGSMVYLTNPLNPSEYKNPWADKLHLLPLNGPASWPIASQDKMPQLLPPHSDGKMFHPGQFSSLLSVGLHPGSPYLPSNLSPAMLPGTFSPSFSHHGLPLPPGIGLHDLAAMSAAKSTISSSGTHASGRSTPEVTDINGNSEKDASNGEQKVYRCEYCFKHFLFKSKYHEHLPVHTNVRPYQCHLCSRTYKYKYDLQVHLRTHMGIPTKSTICPFCNGKFATNKMLRSHIVEAHQDRQKVSKEECTQPVDNLPPAL